MEKLYRLPTIPEYYRDMINKSVDLSMEPKQCCPFHKEDTPSFSYSAEKGKWRCFGGCKRGGDVIDLHQMNYKMQSRSEAEKSLKALYGVVDKVKELQKEPIHLNVNQDRIFSESIYQEALIRANTIDKQLEMDYIMSKYPADMSELKCAMDKW